MSSVLAALVAHQTRLLPGAAALAGLSLVALVRLALPGSAQTTAALAVVAAAGRTRGLVGLALSAAQRVAVAVAVGLALQPAALALLVGSATRRSSRSSKGNHAIHHH